MKGESLDETSNHIVIKGQKQVSTLGLLKRRLVSEFEEKARESLQVMPDALDTGRAQEKAQGFRDCTNHLLRYPNDLITSHGKHNFNIVNSRLRSLLPEGESISA